MLSLMLTQEALGG